jgi:hypothetical protein
VKTGGPAAEAALAADAAEAIGAHVNALREALDDLEDELGGDKPRTPAPKTKMSTKGRMRP